MNSLFVQMKIYTYSRPSARPLKQILTGLHNNQSNTSDSDMFIICWKKNKANTCP